MHVTRHVRTLVVHGTTFDIGKDKADYKTVSDEVSRLHFDSLDIRELLKRNAADRIDDDCGQSTSETASRVSWCWFECRKTEVLAGYGWSDEEFEAAEEEETRKFYKDLENSLADPPRVGEFDHDSGDEEEADFEHVESNV
jgi:hypothetical protein